MTSNLPHAPVSKIIFGTQLNRKVCIVHVKFRFKSLPIFLRFFAKIESVRAFKAKFAHMIQVTDNFPYVPFLDKLISKRNIHS